MAKRRRAKRATRVARRAYAAGRRYLAGTRGTAVEAGAGVAGFYALRFLTSNVEQVNQWWWGPPAALLVGAHVMKRRPKLAQAGSAMAGAAGVLGAFAYETAKASETTGFDTGILYNAGLQTNRALDAFNPPPQMPAPLTVSQPVIEDEPEPSIAEAAAFGL